ncbi:piggyBac transposable element-derived protein 4-like [Macrobrachium rosenbergii]|uniref:piggyBac transposable element-derived protein 4-like n=1 Tax=Macrobrachium rosenbergii TaxID=79674 RepID=UPI0034D5DCB4
MFIPNKPAKYGIKLVMACDAETHYMCNSIPYCGKTTGADRVISLGEFFTTELVKPFRTSGRVVTTDNWFTSLPLAKSLQKYGMHLVGTIRPKPYMPLELLTFPMELGQSVAVYNYEDKATLMCQRVKSTKRMQILSTVHHQPTLVERQKTHIHMYYNATKGGVDTFDQLCAAMTCSRKTRRWPLCVFFGLLNIVVNNAFIIYQHRPENAKVSRRKFAMDLALELCRPWAFNRLQQKRYLPRDVSSLICSVFEVEDITVAANEGQGRSEKRQRCHLCPSSSNARSKILCSNCRKTTCAHHLKYTCEKCSNS